MLLPLDPRLLFRVTLVGPLLYDSYPGNRDRFLFDSTLCSAPFWSAPAKRSGDGALNWAGHLLIEIQIDRNSIDRNPKRCRADACHRTPGLVALAK
jgi:hypothetical protein